MVGKSYDDLLPSLKIQADKGFSDDLAKVKSMAGSMHPARAKQFMNILKNDVLRKFESSGKMHPKTMKEVDSKLGSLASSGAKSIDLDQQQLGAAAREAQNALRRMVERGNPSHGTELKKVNQAFANLLRVEGASSRQGAKGGVFTPNQLEQATRALDSSLRKKQSGHGNALMQDLATAGDAGITNKLPDSGTTPGAVAATNGLLGPVK